MVSLSFLSGMAGGLLSSFGMWWVIRRQQQVGVAELANRLFAVETAVTQNMAASNSYDVDNGEQLTQLQLTAAYYVVRKKINRGKWDKNFKKISHVVDLIEVICHLRLFLHAADQHHRYVSLQEICKKDPTVLNDLHSRLLECETLRPVYDVELQAMQEMLDSWVKA